jgi:hypothetical protein
MDKIEAVIQRTEEQIKQLEQERAKQVDPWAHRSENMLCRSCMYFVVKGRSDFGRCRRHAPTMSGFPAVFNRDWCGDHKLDENKI